MKLTIEITFENNNGVDMETKLNKAISDFGKVITQKGLCEMDLVGQEMIEGDILDFYKIKIEPF